MGWIAILFFFGVFILWASFAPLDKGVVAMGNVITDGQNKIIQPTDNGVIEEILVRDGDVVKAGQILVRLNAFSIPWLNNSVPVERARLIRAVCLIAWGVH